MYKWKRWDDVFKKYLYNGNLLLNCEYIKGKINGIGYDINNNIVNFFVERKEIIYEGEYLNEERNGKGKEYY